MNTLRAFITALLLTSSIGPSWAGTSTITTKDAAGVTKTFDVVTDGSGNFGAMGGVCDGTALAQCAAVKAASTAAGATDPALVVAISPNNSVAVTSATFATSALQTTGNTALTTINTTLGTPFQAGGSIGNTTFAVTNAGTFATQSTLSAETTKVIGTTRVTGNVGGVLDAVGQNVTAPANWLQAGCQFNTSPTTISSGSGSPCQVDNAGNLLVNIKTATGLAQGSTTSGQTGSLIMGAVTTAAPSYTTAQTAYASLTTSGAIRHDITSVNSVAILTGTGATGTGAQRFTVATDQATNAGAALVKGGVGVVNGGSTYQAVAASQTATVLQTSTGAIGDYLSHCDIYPTSTSPGVVTVFDNTNAAAGSAILFPGGATSLSNLAPISVPVGAVSTAGAWKVTTGASVSVVCYGRFS